MVRTCARRSSRGRDCQLSSDSVSRHSVAIDCRSSSAPSASSSSSSPSSSPWPGCLPLRSRMSLSIRS
eukprot:2343614-Rhodomonas_salina.1